MWIEPSKKFEGKPSLLTFPYGTGGVLYPPNSLNEEVFNISAFQKLCPYEDDIWFKAMSLLQKTQVVVTDYGVNPKHHCVFGSQIEALRYINHDNINQNIKQMRTIFKKYSLYKYLTDI